MWSNDQDIGYICVNGGGGGGGFSAFFPSPPKKGEEYIIADNEGNMTMYLKVKT